MGGRWGGSGRSWGRKTMIKIYGIKKSIFNFKRLSFTNLKISINELQVYGPYLEIVKNWGLGRWLSHSTAAADEWGLQNQSQDSHNSSFIKADGASPEHTGYQGYIRKTSGFD